MVGRITPGPNAASLNDNISESFVTATDGKPALAVVNTDGTTISTGGGGASGTQYIEGTTTTPATGNVLLGRYLSSPTGTLTNGQLSAPLLDNYGQQKVVSVGTAAQNLTQINGTTLLLGQTTKSASLPVTIANDQGNILVQDNVTASSLSTISTNTTGLSTATNQTNGTQQTKVTDGTNIANVVAGDNGYNSQVISSGTKTLTFSTSSSGAQILANINTEGYSWVEVVYTSVGVGLALTGQFSPSSGGTYVNSSTFGTSAGGVSAVLGTAVNTIYFSPIHGNYFQIAVSALTSGTFAGTITLRAIPPPYSVIPVTQSGTFTTTAGTSATSTITSIVGTTSSTQLLASNTSRKAGYFFNDSTATLYLAYATSASTTAYTVQIAAGGFFEMPIPVYTGAIFGIWSATNGSVRITEGT